MKIIFNRTVAANTAAPLMCATGGKSLLNTTDGILIEASVPDNCIFTTYDTEKGLRTSVSAKVIEGGSYIINAQKFIQTLRVMQGEEVVLTVDDKLVACISCGKSSHKMSALPGSDFPTLPGLTSQICFEINNSAFRRMIGKTIHAMGINDQRPVLNGCYFKVHGRQLTMVSCDSFRLSKCINDSPVENKIEDGSELRYVFIIPSKTMTELYKLIDDDEEKSVRIYLMRRHIVFIIDEITFFSRLIDGEYIDFDRIIITSHKIKAELDRDEFIAALERAALVTEERVAGSVRSHVKLEFVDGTVKISANSPAGSTYDEIETEQAGDNICIAFNNRYLIESLRSCDSGKIRLSLSSPLMSMNIEPLDSADGVEELYMLLPVRMKD